MNDCIEELKQAISRIESYVGIVSDFYPNQNTISAQITGSNLSSLVPCVEKDLVITNNTFKTTFFPEKIVDSWVVNDQVIINNGTYYISHQGVEFIGRDCYFPDNSYNGFTATLTYFFDPKKQFNLFPHIHIENGLPIVKNIGVTNLDLVIASENYNWNVYIDNNEIKTSKTVRGVTGQNIFIDRLNSLNKYKITVDDSGLISWSIIFV